MNVFEFMSDSPFLSFFLVMVICGAINKIFYSFGKKYDNKLDKKDD